MTQLGKYDILEERGRGGFGIVYKARDRSLERLVALKVLHPQLTVDASFLQRFRKEARDLARISHPNVVTVHEIGEVEGRVYIAMEYLPKGSLADRLAEGSLSLENAVKVTKEVGAGLGAGHAEGLIHRDVKPGNILFNKRNEAVIADFGLAKALRVSSSSVRSTVGAVGTPYYRAPELWNGTPPPSPATDVYALACVFYEMLTGELLFDGDTNDVLIRKHLLEDVHDLISSRTDKVPVMIRPVLEKALAKEPTFRYQSTDSFMKALSQSQHKLEYLKATSSSVQKPASDKEADALPAEPMGETSRDESESVTGLTRVAKRLNTSWALGGCLGITAVIGVVAVIILIYFGITNLGWFTRSARDAPTSVVPAEEKFESTGNVITESPVVEQDALGGNEDTPAEPTPTSWWLSETPIAENTPTLKTEIIPEAYFIEEFDSSNLSSWSLFMMSGDENTMDVYSEGGYLVFDLQGENQDINLMYDEYIYPNVRVDVTADNRGDTTTYIGLVCNYTDQSGWYEFNITKEGFYEIQVYSENDESYYQLAADVSTNVRSEQELNTYSVICTGNELKLLINGSLEIEYVDTRYNLTEGKVGISVSSYGVMPVQVYVDSIAISQP